jgi:succinate-semialdehyde dehydrogenase/glutarate-semialdehyde dehydrogenase
MEGYEKLAMLTDGEWLGATGRKTQPVVNPATEEVLGELPLASNADLDRALEASRRGFREWKAMSALQRQAIMERAASLIEQRKEHIARTCTMEMGKPIAESRMEVDFVAGVTRWYGEEGKRAYGRLVPPRLPGVRQMVMKEPVGPVAAFVAWNFPGTNVIRKIAGAVGAGCSIIIKASEETPGTAIAIARCFQDAGLPKGVLNVVFGVPDEVSRYLLASPIPRKVSFTGSVPVGKHLQKLAADTLKRCTMELGGHAPVVIFDDADLPLAVKQTVAFKFRNAGQVCISPTRFFVQDKVYDRFVDMFAAEARKIVVGNGLDEKVQMGPLIAERRLSVMDRFVSDAQEKGAEVLCGGKRIANRGYFFEPTVLGRVPHDAMIMNEEPFGPLAPMTTFTELEEAVEFANRLPFGLASYVYTQSPSRRQAMEERIEAGLVGVNHTMVSLPETPFGGVNESGYGSEGGIEGLDAYLRTKFVTEFNQ